MATMLGALDIGTSTSRLYAGQVVDNTCEVLACVSSPTMGVSKGVIRDIDAVAKMVESLQHKMSTEYHIDLYDVEVNFSSMGIVATHRQGHKAIPAGAEIIEADIIDAEENATVHETPDTTDITFQQFLQKYEVDGHPVSTPIGMKGSSLVANLLELTAPRVSYEAIKSVLHRAGMHSQEVCHSGVAVLEAVLDDKMREDGAIVIDFGAGVVDYAAACHGVLATAGTLAVGGKHITSDLAYAFKLSQQQAEEVKRQCGSAMLQFDRAKERYEVPENLLSRGTSRSISIHAIQTVTTERIDETLRLIYDMLVDKDILSHIHGVYLTGMVASTPGIVDRASQIFAMPCYLGKPQGVKIIDTMQDHPYWHATGIGLLKCCKDRLSREVEKPSIFSQILKFFKN